MKRILFVDDDYAALECMRAKLAEQQHRWEMRFVLSGEAALAECAASRFDVVVADVRMPGMDGVALLGEVKQRLPGAARLLISDRAEYGLALRSVAVADRVLAKSCEPMELVATLERIEALQDLFCTEQIRKIIGTLGALPSLSHTYLALTRAVQDPDAHVASVAEIVEQDVAMSAKVLQLVNSGFFGLAQTVTRVHTAVSYLGMETVKNLALASEAFGIFEPGVGIPRGFLERLQRQAQRTAVIVSSLPLSVLERDTALVAALLHDLGELMLASRMPHMLCSALALAKKRGLETFEAEESLMDVSHAELGAYLLGVWGIGSAVVEAVAHHHRPTRIAHAGLDAAGAVYLAALLAEELEAHPLDAAGRELKAHDREALEQLGLLARYAQFRERATLALRRR